MRSALSRRSRPCSVVSENPAWVLRVRALGGGDREVVHGQAVVAAVDAEHLADDPEFEGVHTIKQDDHVFQHAASVPRRWQEMEGVRRSCH